MRQIPVMTAAPFHVATINGQSVRFFQSPLEGPDWAWVVLEDVVRTIPLSDFWREQAVQGWPGANPTSYRHVDLDGRQVMIVPDIGGTGFYAFLAQQGYEVEPARSEYMVVTAELFCVLHVHLSGEALKAAAQQAGLRHAVQDGKAH